MIKKLSIVLALFLASCSPLIKHEQAQNAGFATLEAGASLGQTFVSRYDGLDGISVYLKPGAPGVGNLQLRLHNAPHAPGELASASLPLEQVTATGFYRFRFPALTLARNRDYYFALEIDGSGSLLAGTAPGEAYLNGALYQNMHAQDAQLTFRLAYAPGQAAAGLLGEGLTWLVWMSVAILLFILPGWAVLGGLWPAWKLLSWPVKSGLAGGLSLAIYPLLFLWTNLAGLQLGPFYAWLPPLAGIAGLVWQNRAAFRRWPIKRQTTESRSSRWFYLKADCLPELAFLVVTGLLLFTRFWAIRSLDAPMWGDSYQHTLMAQLLVENSGLFNSWEPYASLKTFTYHFGFHSLAAVFHWITSLPLEQAVLWTGQITNCLAVIAIYPLAWLVTRNRWAGVVGMLVAGLLVPVPMVYVNWGRYTQLAGQSILLSAIYLSWSLLDGASPRKSYVLAWIALGGLALTHYRVLVFGLLFFAAYFLMNFRRGQANRLVSRVFWIGSGAAILFLPWFARVFSGSILTIFRRQVTMAADQISDFTRLYNAIGDIFVYLPALIWILMPLAIGWGLWRGERGIALVSLWWFLILLAANPQWLNLPGAGALTNFAVFIAAYIPAALFLGAAAGWLAQAAGRQADRLRPGASAVVASLLCATVVAAGMWGARQRLSDVRPMEGVLFTRPDGRAAAWIRQNTPTNAIFLVNSFFTYENAIMAGSDGGWWLPFFAHRQTTLPPLNYGNEQGPTPDYRKQVNALIQQVRDLGIDHPETLDALAERGITHIYIGQRHGRVNSDEPVVEPGELLASPAFKPVYHEDRVWVFEILPAQASAKKPAP